MDIVLEAKGLNKSFGNQHAVIDLDIRVEKGQVYGLLGQNGAGKSTLIRMLLGLIFPDSGDIFLMGDQFNSKKRHLLKNIGAIIERPDVYNYLDGFENLNFFATLSGHSVKKERIYEVLKMVGLLGREKDKVKTYSLGMKQRLGIAIALVHDPALLILDEPTNGLDPQGIADIRNLILQLSKEHNKTILLSSHLLHEVEQMASHMLIIHKGKKIKEGLVRAIIQPEESIVEISMLNYLKVDDVIKNTPWEKHIVEINPNKIVLKMNQTNIPYINQFLVEKGVPITGIHSENSLENYFLNLTND